MIPPLDRLLLSLKQAHQFYAWLETVPLSPVWSAVCHLAEALSLESTTSEFYIRLQKQTDPQSIMRSRLFLEAEEMDLQSITLQFSGGGSVSFASKCLHSFQMQMDALSINWETVEIDVEGCVSRKQVREKHLKAFWWSESHGEMNHLGQRHSS